jgi:hypothetical protein
MLARVGMRWFGVVAILVVGFAPPGTTRTTTHAFSTSPNSSSSSSSSQPSATTKSIEHAFIEFVDVTTPSSSNNNNNKLPVSWTQNWSTWVLEPRKSTTTTTTAAAASGTTTQESMGFGDVFVKIPDTHGFVPPSSVDTLFQPIDLMAPSMSLALGVHM